MLPSPPRPSRRWWSLVPVAALLAFTAVLRAPIGVVPPLLPLLRTDLGLTAVQAGLLTSIPVLCFGLLTPAASALLRHTGINHGALYCLAGIVGGSVLRSAGGVGAAYAGTVLIGAGITIGNLVVPMLIGRQFQHRAPLLTGAYSGTVNTTVTAATKAKTSATTTAGSGTRSTPSRAMTIPETKRMASPTLATRTRQPDPESCSSSVGTCPKLPAHLARWRALYVSPGPDRT